MIPSLEGQRATAQYGFAAIAIAISQLMRLEDRLAGRRAFATGCFGDLLWGSGARPVGAGLKQWPNFTPGDQGFAKLRQSTTQRPQRSIGQEAPCDRAHQFGQGNLVDDAQGQAQRGQYQPAAGVPG